MGARPLNAEEQRKMYMHNGRIWKVSDDPLDPIYRRVRVGDWSATSSPASLMNRGHRGEACLDLVEFFLERPGIKVCGFLQALQ